METTFLCLVCGKEYKPIRSNQKYCSIRCKNRADKSDRRFGGIRDYILERDGYKCTECSSETMLIVHHKDWIRTNNDPSNLITLCSSCHKKEHFEITDNKETRTCQICGDNFHPLMTKRKTQFLCGRKECKAKWKAIQKRSSHEDVSCKICGKTFTQKHSKHYCCRKECSLIYASRSKKAWRSSNAEQIRIHKSKYYYENKDRIKAYVKKWQEANPDKVRGYIKKSANHKREQ